MDELTSDLLAMLKRLEWDDFEQDGDQLHILCSVCGAYKFQGFDVIGPHKPDCEYAALLKRAEEK